METTTGVYIPITFINTSPNLGTVFKCAVSIFRTDEPEQRFFMLWREFSKIAADGNWSHEGQAHSFAVNEKTSISRTAWFIWLMESNPKLYFKKGSYTLILHLWIGRDKKPKNTKFNFYISQEAEEFFINRIQAQSKNIKRILLNKDIDRNRILTIHESKILLE